MANDTKNKLVIRGPREAVDEFVRRHVRTRATVYGPADNLALDTFVEEPTGKHLTYLHHGYEMMTDDLVQWRLASWGVKWNSYHGELTQTDDGAVLTFDTANSWPQPIYARLQDIIASDLKLLGLEIDFFAFCEGWTFAVEGTISSRVWIEQVRWDLKEFPDDARRIFIECHGCTPEEDEAAARADWTESDWADEAAALAADEAEAA